MDIVLKNISKSYEEGEKKHEILNNLDVKFKSQCFSLIYGKSGSGKSTILNLISGMDSPDSGIVNIGDISLTGLSDSERTLFRRRKIGFIFQFFNLIPTLSVLENVCLINELEGRNSKDNIRMAGTMLEEVGLSGRMDSMPDRLSGGEQQRVAIARALAHDPEIIIADEPTGNLDLETGNQILEKLFRLTKEKRKTMVMVSHSIEALQYADNVFQIKNKKLIKKSPELDKSDNTESPN